MPATGETRDASMSPVRRPTREEVLVFDVPGDFRAWLEANGAVEREAFIGYYRKGSAKTAMTYAEAVDEALCHGWIDGITYRVDDELTASRFTPRRPRSNWSAVNVAKVARLIEAGRMAPAGLAAFEARPGAPPLRCAPPAASPGPPRTR